MGLATDNHDWVVGSEDECWWSRLALPSLHSWAEAGKPLRVVQRSIAKDDPAPKAISCYGLFLPEFGRTWLRFVDGRPISGITRRFLEWCCQKLEAAGKKKVFVLIWDNASWHISREVRRWIGSHNRALKKSGRGIRIVTCLLPKKSPWLNPIEPKWIHGKRRVVEADGLLGAHELARAATLRLFYALAPLSFREFPSETVRPPIGTSCTGGITPVLRSLPHRGPRQVRRA